MDQFALFDDHVQPDDELLSRLGRTVGIVSPTAAGSLGDQAMIDAATSFLGRWRPTLVFPHAPALRSDATVRSGPGWIGAALAGLRGIMSTGPVLFVGADVVDGVYSAASSLKRLKLLSVAHGCGAATRVLSASWSETPAPENVRYLRRAHWLDMRARDPVSRDRMERDLDREVGLVADLAFLLRPEAASDAARSAIDWAGRERARGATTILAVNLSGHTIKTLPGGSVAPFAALIARWLDADPGRRVLIVPHDTREGMRGDLTVTADLAAALHGEYAARLHTMLPPFDAWDAKAVVGACDLVLTGRMHLAIAALGMGVPPVCVVYQGKFEGLLAHFGLEREGLTLLPQTPGAEPQQALGLLERATARRADLSRAITGELPRIERLARNNFEGL